MMTTAVWDAPVPLLDTAALYRAYAHKVGRWAIRLTHSSSDADDIVQEVFLTAHQRIPSLEELRQPAAWLHKITQNIVRHLWRSRGRAAARCKAYDLEKIPSASPNPLEQLERHRAAEQVDHALQTLDERTRQLYWLCEINEVPCARVAALTGVNPQTLRVRRFRARRQMADQLRSAAAA